MAKQEQAIAEEKEYRYRTSGSGALQPAVQPEEAPRRKGQGKRQLSPGQARKQKQKAGIRVRQQEAIAPLSIIGLVAVAILATFVIYLRVELNQINTQLSTNSTTLSQLEKEGESLLNQYEKMFDMGSIERKMLSGGKMSKPSSSQSVYLELSEPDHAEVFQTEEGVFQIIQNKLEAFAEYFQ